MAPAVASQAWLGREMLSRRRSWGSWPFAVLLLPAGERPFPASEPTCRYPERFSRSFSPGDRPFRFTSPPLSDGQSQTFGTGSWALAPQAVRTVPLAGGNKPILPWASILLQVCRHRRSDAPPRSRHRAGHQPPASLPMPIRSWVCGRNYKVGRDSSFLPDPSASRPALQRLEGLMPGGSAFPFEAEADPLPVGGSSPAARNCRPQIGRAHV